MRPRIRDTGEQISPIKSVLDAHVLFANVPDLVALNVRQSIWRERVDMHTKLYGPLPELEKTVAFIAQTGIGI